MKFSCKSVINGWQTAISFDDKPDVDYLVGPALNGTTELWAWQSKNLPQLPQPQPDHGSLQVRILVGAAAAYACIKTDDTSMDVLLAPGKSPGASLRESAREMREKAHRLQRRAALMEAAVSVLDGQKVSANQTTVA